MIMKIFLDMSSVSLLTYYNLNPQIYL